MNYGMRCHRCDIRGADPNVTAVTLNGVSQQESRTRTPRQLSRFKTAKYVQFNPLKPQTENFYLETEYEILLLEDDRKDAGCQKKHPSEKKWRT